MIAAMRVQRVSMRIVEALRSIRRQRGAANPSSARWILRRPGGGLHVM
jgi:hypothetical protein